ncbi:Modification methylase HhaI [subsurface metagenome]
MGYDLQWQVLNSKDFGVPQNRERVFIVGHIRGECRPEIFPIGKGDNNVEEKHRGVKTIGHFNKIAFGQANKVYEPNGISPTITSGQEDFIPSIIINEIQPKQIMDGSQSQRVYNSKGISVSIKAVGGGQGAKTGLYQVGELKQKRKIIKNIKIRRLTPIECERLQGFPDNFTEGVSDTQRYKMLGNAVTTNVITEIGRKLLL